MLLLLLSVKKILDKQTSSHHGQTPLVQRFGSCNQDRQWKQKKGEERSIGWAFRLLCAWFVEEQISNLNQNCKETCSWAVNFQTYVKNCIGADLSGRIAKLLLANLTPHLTATQSQTANWLKNQFCILLNLKLAQHQVGTIPCSHPHAYFPDQVAWLPCVWSQLSVYGIIRIGFMGSLRPFYTWGMCLMEVISCPVTLCNTL